MNTQTQQLSCGIQLAAWLLAFAATAHADLRTSTDYTVAADTTDAGGQHLPLSLRVNSSKFCILFVSDF